MWSSAGQDATPPPPATLDLLPSSASAERRVSQPRFKEAAPQAGLQQTDPQLAQGPVGAQPTPRRQAQRPGRQPHQRTEEEPEEPAEHPLPPEHSGAGHERIPRRVRHVQTDLSDPELQDQPHLLLEQTQLTPSPRRNQEVSTLPKVTVNLCNYESY